MSNPRPFKIPESVLVVIHTPALEVLLLERADRPGSWQSVTGSLDALDEPLAATCAREVLEETGIAIAQTLGAVLTDWKQENRYVIFKQWSYRYAPGTTHNTEHVFGLCVPAVMPVRLSPREHLAWRWVPWQEAARACFSPSNAQAIEQLQLRLRGGEG